MWPYLLAVSGIPAILQLVTLPLFPETPRYLYIDKGDTEGSTKGESRQQRSSNYKGYENYIKTISLP